MEEDFGSRKPKLHCTVRGQYFTKQRKNARTPPLAQSQTPSKTRQAVLLLLVQVSSNRINRLFSCLQIPRRTKIRRKIQQLLLATDDDYQRTHTHTRFTFSRRFIVGCCENFIFLISSQEQKSKHTLTNPTTTRTNNILVLQTNKRQKKSRASPNTNKSNENNPSVRSSKQNKTKQTQEKPCQLLRMDFRMSKKSE